MLAAFFLAFQIDGDYFNASTLETVEWRRLFLVAAFVFFAVLVSAYRLKCLFDDFGYTIAYPQALRGFTISALVSVVFFNIFGQLVARSSYFRRSEISSSSVILITGYERLLAALISGLAALIGALFLYGQVVIDWMGGGAAFARLLVGVTLVLVCAITFGLRGDARQSIVTFVRQIQFLTVARVALLSLAIQACMLAAYLAAVWAFVPGSPSGETIAALTIVMFAASLPISPSGWGVRELSAVLALATIGVPAASAFGVALSIGLSSVLVFSTLWLLTSGFDHRKKHTNSNEESNSDSSEDNYNKILARIIVFFATIYIGFQVRVPVELGFVNVNLVDAIAIVGLIYISIVFPKEIISNKIFLCFLSLISFVIAFALINGFMRYGFIEWAFINRGLGWLIILSYCSLGILCQKAYGRDGLAHVARLSAAAVIAIGGLNYFLLLLSASGLSISSDVLIIPLQGFLNNRNAFSFYSLLVISLLIIFSIRDDRVLFLAIVLTGVMIVLSGSRAGWIGLFCVVCILAYYRSVSMRFLAQSSSLIFVLAIIPSLFAFLVQIVDDASLANSATALNPALISILPNASTNSERLGTITYGLQLFSDNIWFGAGLGAFSHAYESPTSTLDVIHSNYVWILAEFGIVGAVIVLCATIMLILPILSRMRTDVEATTQFLAAICVIMAVFGLVHDVAFQRSFWFFLGLICFSPAMIEEYKRIRPAKPLDNDA